MLKAALALEKITKQTKNPRRSIYQIIHDWKQTKKCFGLMVRISFTGFAGSGSVLDDSWGSASPGYRLILHPLRGLRLQVPPIKIKPPGIQFASEVRHGLMRQEFQEIPDFR